jgi:phosphatidylglycerophosphatase A
MIMKFIAKVVSTFFGAGYFPVAPGTFASLAAVLIYRFVLAGAGGPLFAAVIAAVYLIGVAAAGSFSRQLGEPDPGRIVIDEVVGQWIGLFLIPATWLNIGLAFSFSGFSTSSNPWASGTPSACPGAGAS